MSPDPSSEQVLTMTCVKEIKERNREVCLCQTPPFSNARLIEHLVAGYWLLNIRRSFRAMHVGLE
jgi:hypothetical protein